MKVSPPFHRLSLLIGEEAVAALQTTEVAVFGVGGVGSWAAESLVRSGVGSITLVDSDTVCITNLNRQLQATTKNIGKSKVMELAKRLKEIAPRAEIRPIHAVYEDSRREDFELQRFDYVLDAIDTLKHKIDLLRYCTELDVPVFSSMGAGNKLDPTCVQSGSIWKSRIDRLAALVRKKLRQSGFQGDFPCVWSEESPMEIPHTSVRDGSHKCFCSDEIRDCDDPEIVAKDWCDSKHEINGSCVQVSAVFGHVLAGLVVKDVVGRLHSQK